MFNRRRVQMALFGLAIVSVTAASWLKSYIVDNQHEWNGISDVIHIHVFGEFLAPKTIGFSYLASCSATIIFTALLAVTSAKQK